jgi:hypothetical protein
MFHHQGKGGKGKGEQKRGKGKIAACEVALGERIGMGKKAAKSRSSKAAGKDLRLKHRGYLAEARKDYQRGRAYKAIEKHSKAQQLRDEMKLPYDSKAHAIFELGLAHSMCMTDYCTNDKQAWAEHKAAMTRCYQQAYEIYESRLSDGQLQLLRTDEVWLAGTQLLSSVPQQTRLGPMDYLTCTAMLAHALGPSTETVKQLRSAISLVDRLETEGWKCCLSDNLSCVLEIDGEPPRELLQNTLAEFELAVGGDLTG